MKKIASRCIKWILSIWDPFDERIHNIGPISRDLLSLDTYIMPLNVSKKKDKKEKEYFYSTRWKNDMCFYSLPFELNCEKGTFLCEYSCLSTYCDEGISNVNDESMERKLNEINFMCKVVCDNFVII